MLSRCYSQEISLPKPEFPEEEFYNDDEPVSVSEDDPFKTISPRRLAEMLTDPNSHDYEAIVICDARFEYEFKGGNIRGAHSVCSHSQLHSLYHRYLGKKVAFIFHCEFSHNRGPTLLKAFRKYDREVNRDRYPYIAYQDCFLLEGGYHKFYSLYPELCKGSYTPMRDQRYTQNGELKRSHSAYINEMSDHPVQRVKRAPSLDSGVLFAPLNYSLGYFDHFPLSASQGCSAPLS